jgi:transketolase
VRIIGIGGGFAYGHAGMTHYALEDYAVLGAQPGLAVIAPADPAQTRTVIRDTCGLPGPVYYRIGKGGDPVLPELGGRFSIDAVETVGSGRDVLLLATGGIAADAVAVAREMGNVTVGIAATLNPAPVTALKRLLAGFTCVLTVEEHYARGGLGSITASVIAESGKAVRLKVLGIDDVQAGVAGSRDFMLKRCGMDRAALVSEVKSLLKNPKP